MGILQRVMVVVVILSLVLPPASAGASVEAPRVSVDSINALSVPDHPFDPNADADRAIDAAFTRAARDHKRVLIDLGGNWCADCRILQAVMTLPEMQSFIAAHYEVVIVDVGRMNKNLQIVARFGVTQPLDGVPAVLIADPDGSLVDRGHVEALVDTRTMTPQAIADWIASWAD